MDKQNTSLNQSSKNVNPSMILNKLKFTKKTSESYPDFTQIENQDLVTKNGNKYLSFPYPHKISKYFNGMINHPHIKIDQNQALRVKVLY